MLYMMWLFILGTVVGVLLTTCHSSPYFGAIGLVLVSGAGCGMLALCGASFFSLVLFLIYLGGMLVVFCYSSALAAEMHPDTLEDESVSLIGVNYFLVFLPGGMIFFMKMSGWTLLSLDVGGGSMACIDAMGAGLLYGLGGHFLVLGGWVLLLALFVVLEVCRGVSYGMLRAV
uniref:NADH-ubiquinone oxidoreductase chain 6 n=1 Tax=Brachygobius kabiliensis TaxID=228545 RepID=A0A1S5QIV7_9GOBI|nr:NADH dehydrogenase subunit 6 [Brachygobius kabiliensis]